MAYGRAILERGGDVEEMFFSVLNVVAACDEDALSASEKCFSLVGRFVSQVSNGGFDQYFFNSGAWEAHDCAAALGRIGASRMRALLSEAIAVVELPAPVPSSYRYEATSEQEHALDLLDSQLFQIVDEPYDQAVQFLRKNVREFGAPA